MKEKRKHKRFSLDKSIQAINVLDGRSLGVLINISEGGFMTMCGENSPRRGDILQLRLLDPEEKSLDIMAGATCIWQEEAHASNSYWCGFKFIDLSSDAHEVLSHFLEGLEKSS
jgi:c-di-GMP-binding flagellar brake protein YcgR